MSKPISFGLGPLSQFPLRDWQSLAPHIEQLGYRTLWIPDERFYRDVVTTLSVIAESTARLGLGTAVTDPYVRHPALTAQWTASLDALSQGRMHVGIGAGFAGFSAMGIEHDRPALAIREMVDLMRRLWQGGTVDMQGQTVSFHQAALDFQTLRERIPCYIAGRGKLILRLAGEIGEGVILGSLAAEGGLRYAFSHIDAGLDRSGRAREDLDVAIWLHTAVAPDRQQARQAVRMIVVGVLLSSLGVLEELGVELGAELQQILSSLRYIHGSPEMMATAAMLPDGIIDQFAVAGPPEEVAGRIGALREAGVNHIALKPWLVPGQSFSDYIELVAEEVMPRVS
jgi:5,10-methylenetetrahydromethanopterin reductase